jgi:hypothetical protein
MAMEAPPPERGSLPKWRDAGSPSTACARRLEAPARRSALDSIGRAYASAQVRHCHLGFIFRFLHCARWLGREVLAAAVATTLGDRSRECGGTCAAVNSVPYLCASPLAVNRAAVCGTHRHLAKSSGHSTTVWNMLVDRNGERSAPSNAWNRGPCGKMTSHLQ